MINSSHWSQVLDPGLGHAWERTRDGVPSAAPGGSGRGTDRQHCHGVWVGLQGTCLGACVSRTCCLVSIRSFYKDPREPRHPRLPRQRSDTKVSVTPRETSLGTRHLMASIACVRPPRGPVRRDSVSHEFPWRLRKTQRDAGALSSYASVLSGSDFSTCFWRLLGSPNQASFRRWMFALPSQGGSTKDG